MFIPQHVYIYIIQYIHVYMVQRSNPTDSTTSPPHHRGEGDSEFIESRPRNSYEWRDLTVSLDLLRPGIWKYRCVSHDPLFRFYIDKQYTVQHLDIFRCRIIDHYSHYGTIEISLHVNFLPVWNLIWILKQYSNPRRKVCHRSKNSDNLLKSPLKSINHWITIK
jgi:hypothetical protein